MKRSITMSVGALVLSQLLAFTALAAPKCYSTGPLTQEDPATDDYVVEVLNNGEDDTVEAVIVAFDLDDGPKTMLGAAQVLLVDPLHADDVVISDLGEIMTFEIQVKLDGMAEDKFMHGKPADNVLDNVLLGGFAENGESEALRLVHSEWTEIDCQDFALVPDEGVPEVPDEEPEPPGEDAPGS
jgi:hypothetical protein